MRRDWVVSAFAERVTAQDAPRCERCPAQRAELLDGVDGVLAAGRREAAARRGEWGDEAPVETQRCSEGRGEETHSLPSAAARLRALLAWAFLARSTSSARVSSMSGSRAAAAGIMTRSQPGGRDGYSRRKASRKIRRTRLRFTADFQMRLPTERPRRVWLSPCSKRTTWRIGPLARAPCL
jgi:hypothetical protein